MESPKSEQTKCGFFAGIDGRVSLSTAMLLAPLAYCIHHMEEKLGGFRTWRLQYFPDSNPLPTEYVFVVLTALTLVLIILFCIRNSRAAAEAVVLFLMATQVNNALFHAGGGLYFNDYSPGTISALALYLPVNSYICIKGIKAGLFTKRSVTILFVLGGVLFWLFEKVGPAALLCIVLVFLYVAVSELREKKQSLTSRG